MARRRYVPVGDSAFSGLSERWRMRAPVSPLACFACLVCLLNIFGTAPAVAGPGDGYWSPWVTKTTTDSATINWRGGSDASGSIDYATSRYFSERNDFEKTISSVTAGRYQHVTLTGLEAGTSYVYRVRPLDASGAAGATTPFGNRSFRTLPVSGPFTFIVISDSQEGHHYTEETRFRLVAEAIAKEPDVLFILHGGDYARYNDEARWTDFFKVADGMLARTAIYPTIGNHEYHNIKDSATITAAENFRQAFDIPFNYSFDCAGIRFIVLETPDPSSANGDDPHTSSTLAQSQTSWLRERLSSALSGIFTIHHHPIWDEGRTDINADLKPWEDLYHTFPISANFSGHTHNYQRFSVDGIPYFIVGAAGGPFAEASDIKPVGYRQGETRQLGYLRVAVDPSRNTATAQMVFVASVKKDDSDETPHLYKSPVIGDTVTFPLSRKP